MKHRILVVSQHYWPESFRINDICDFFVQKGCSVDVLCGIPNYPKGCFFDGYGWLKNKKQKHNGVNITRACEIPRGNSSIFRVFCNNISFAIFSITHIPRLLFNKYDKIFLFQTSPVIMTIAGILIGKITKTETIMYVGDLWPENLFSMFKTKNKIFIRLITVVSHWHYRQADKLIVLSEKMKDKLTQTTQIDTKKIIILPQACEKIYETPIHDQGLIEKFKDGFNIVFTGYISPAQSFETIIDAAKILKDDGLNDINWIIVGDGMSKDWLKEQFKKAGLSNSAYFEGQKSIDDIPKYFFISSILIACLVKSDLLDATIPSKIMSYIAAGRPVVLAMDGEVQTLINDTIKCGFAGPAGDAQSLSTNIKKIYKLSAKDRSTLGKRARKYHFEYLERDLVLGKLYDFIFSQDKL